MSVSSNQVIRRSGLTARGNCPVGASTRLYEGTLAFINSATGYLDDDTATGVNKFAGVMVEEADNSGGAAGDVNGEYFTEGDFVLTGAGFTPADVGKTIYASDNFTITLTAASNSEIGVSRRFISATELLVAIKRKL